MQWKWLGYAYDISTINSSSSKYGDGFTTTGLTLANANLGGAVTTFYNYRKAESVFLDGQQSNGGSEPNQIFGTIGTVSTMSSVVPTTIGTATTLISKTANYTDDIAKVAKVASRTSTGLGLVSVGATYANYKMGNVSEGTLLCTTSNKRYRIFRSLGCKYINRFIYY